MALSYNEKKRRDAELFASWDAAGDAPFEAMACDKDAWKQLQAEIQGTVVLPTDKAAYDKDRKLTNPIFEGYPKGIVYCEGTGNDVFAAVTMARECGLNIRTRSGGHSTAGYSTGPGMLLDTSRMNAGTIVEGVGPTGNMARVQPGCRFRQLNATLNAKNLHVPGGGCPDVAVGGYMQGGGFGFSSRMFGMNCDNVIGATMVTPAGQTVRATKDVNADLFWSLRGGTGNQFGVLTEIDYGLIELPNTWGFALSWPLETPMQVRQAAKDLVTMQEQFMAGANSDINGDLGYMTVICGQPDGTPPQADGSHLKPTLLMRGMIVGEFLGRGEGPLKQRLAPFERASLDWSYYGNYEEMNHWLLSYPVEVPDFPTNQGEPFEHKDARYVGESTTLDVGDWTNLISLVLRCPNPYYVLVLEPYGGAINRVGAEENAFIHRDAAFDIFLDGYWWDPADQGPVDEWLQSFTDYMNPFWNQHVYQNYPNGNLDNYRWNYFGNGFPTLLQTKQKYDPDNLFSFPQSITPVPEDEKHHLTVSTAKPLFPKTPIQT